jgi:dTDP-4-amino-4,6-dideoxygalactose transaminase
MKLRHLPPAAAPLSVADLWSGVVGAVAARRAIARLERELSSALDVPHAFAVSSGRAALVVILRALHRLSGDRWKVIVPAYTCFSVPAAVVRTGLEPVLCDIDVDTFDYDQRQLEQLVADGVPPLAVISAHLFGLPADVAGTRMLCEPHGVFVIDDAAQGLGVRTADGLAGTLGDVGFYSFGRGKAVTSVHGGAIVTRSSEIAAAIASEHRALESPRIAGTATAMLQALAIATLSRPSLYGVPASVPFLRLGQTEYSTSFGISRLSGFQAGLLRRWRRRLATTNSARLERIRALRRVLAPANADTSVPCIRLPLMCESGAERQRLHRASSRERLGFSTMYPCAVNEIPELRDRFAGQTFPNAQRAAERLLTVPVHPLVSSQDRVAIERLLLDARAAARA